MLGFLDPCAGSVWMDGVSVAEADHRSWLDHIAWMPQRPTLSADTVAGNVRLGAFWGLMHATTDGAGPLNGPWTIDTLLAADEGDGSGAWFALSQNESAPGMPSLRFTERAVAIASSSVSPRHVTWPILRPRRASLLP